jgi:hypothetical protein
MSHAEKVNRMEEHLGALGVPRSTFAPPIYRALWRLGIPVPPPLFTGYLALTLFQGSLFALFWGIPMWVFTRSFVPALYIVAGSLGSGLLFGLVMAALVRRKARELRLPTWAQYGGPA